MVIQNVYKFLPIISVLVIILSCFAMKKSTLTSEIEIFILITEIPLLKTIFCILFLSIIVVLFCLASLLLFPRLTIKTLKYSVQKNFNTLLSNVFKIYQSISISDDVQYSFLETLLLGISITFLNIIQILISSFIDQLKDDLSLLSSQQENESFILRKQIKVNLLFLMKQFISVIIFQVVVLSIFDLKLNLITSFDLNTIFRRGATFAFVDLIFDIIIQLINFTINSLTFLNTENLQKQQFSGLIAILTIQILQLAYYIIISFNTLLYIYFQRDIFQNTYQIDLKIRKILQSLLFSEIIDFIQYFKNITKSLKQLSLNWKTLSKLNDFPIPTFEQLYDATKEEVLADKNKYISDAICTVCMDVMDLVSEENSVRILACGHCYHTGCIKKWLNSGNSQCPVCNKGVFDVGNEQKAERGEERELEGEVNFDLVQEPQESEEEHTETEDESSQQKVENQIKNEIPPEIITEKIVPDLENSLVNDILVLQPQQLKQQADFEQFIFSGEKIEISKDLLDLQPEKLPEKQLFSVPIFVPETVQDVDFEQILEAINVSVERFKNELLCKKYLDEHVDVELELIQIKRDAEKENGGK